MHVICKAVRWPTSWDYAGFCQLFQYRLVESKTAASIGDARIDSSDIVSPSGAAEEVQINTS
jgi:hypothetical protein